MSLTNFFKKLGAPLANSRRSWGAERSDGTVVLRVWQDEERKIDGSWFVRVTYHEKFEQDANNSGFQERIRHIELVRQGHRCLMAMCLAKDVQALPRQIKSFNKEDLFVGGKVIELDGDSWIERTGRINARSIST